MGGCKTDKRRRLRRFGIDASHIASAAAGLENDPTIGADPERLQRAGLLTLRAVLTGR